MDKTKCPRCGRIGGRHIRGDMYKNVYRCFYCKYKFFISTGYIDREHLNYICLAHQGKESAFVDALSMKYNRIERSTRTNINFVLSDSDMGGRLSTMRRMVPKGCRRFFIYPHSARPNLLHDVRPAWDGITAQFVVNEYHAEVIRQTVYNKAPLEGVGWYLSPICEFKQREHARRVLFAPIHPRNAEQDKRVNQETFKRLYKLVISGDIELTVRYIGEIEDNGLTKAERVQYIKGEMNGESHNMESADVIIAHQTFAWMGVAMGYPVVMMGESVPTHYSFRSRGGGWKDVPSWNKIYDLIRYPLDILEESDTLSLLNRAVKSDCDIEDWRRRMIGEPFDPVKFVRVLESYL